MFDDLLKAAVGAVGIATGAAYLPQAVRMWKRRSSADVSVLTYVFFLVGQIIWLAYGIRFDQKPVVVGMAANIAGNLAVILTALRFRSAPPAAPEAPAPVRQG
jgi:MtN3 and saliva related transmembrane protein